MYLKKISPQSNVARDDCESFEKTSVSRVLGMHSGSWGIMISDLNKSEAARKGLTKASALHLQGLLGITGQQMSALLDMSYRTYQRKSGQDSVGQSPSEHLILIAEVFVYATIVLGSADAAREWIHSPVVGLSGQKPLDLLDTTFGTRMVHQALGRLEHGIFA